MERIYEAKFFYGRPITESDIAILVGHPSMSLEEVWNTYRYNDDVIETIAELFKPPVKVEIVLNAFEDEPFDPYLVIDNIYEPIWESEYRNHARFKFQLNRAEWDRQLKEACDRQHLSWQQPQFYLTLDYDRCAYIRHFTYYGAFFYGLEVLDVPTLTKKLLETEKMQHIIKSDEDAHNWVKLRNLFDTIDNLWAQRGDLVRLGFIPTRDREIAYLAIRSTFHSVDSRRPVTDFDALEQNSDDWDRLLTEKCTTYGYKYAAPTFHTIINDCYY